MARPPFRKVNFGPVGVAVECRAGGIQYVRSTTPLGTYPGNLCQVLAERAALHPERTFLASREGRAGNWRTLSYATAKHSADAVGQALLERRLGTNATAMMLSGNSIEFAQFMLGAMAAGVPTAPVSPAYSLISADFAILRSIAALIQPAIVFVQDAGLFERALAALPLDKVEVIAVAGTPALTPTTDFATLTNTVPGAAITESAAAIGADDVAKYLFTSGSTGQPKAVINTHRMMCSNVKMQRLMRPLGEGEFEIVVDWLPWHHTFGGNANFNAVMSGGSTLYIDRGRPLPGRFAETVRNLKDISPTTYASVPAAFAMLAQAMEDDSALRDNFFRRLNLMIYGGAALPADLLDRMQDLAVAATGERIAFISGYGATETAPSITGSHWISERSNLLGLPLPGVELKLVPRQDRFEIRVRGPIVTPGYYKRPDLTQAAFDDEGFYRIGDAARWINPGDARDGLAFAGRTAENFKLTTGTWVHTGTLRTALLAAASPLLSDAVIAAPDRDYLGMLAWPNIEAARKLCDGATQLSETDLLTRPEVVDYLRQGLRRHNERHPGTGGRIVRAMLLREVPNIDAGEITDKGYINQRIALQRRAAEVRALYESEPGADVIIV